MNNKRIQIRHANGKYYLLDMEQDGLNYKIPPVLNESAVYIYNSLENEKTVEEIALDMSNRFGITVEEAAADINEFIKQMEEKGIIRKD